MKTIYDSSLGKTVWSGEGYLVLGQPGILEPHHHLLTISNTPQPPHDPATQALVHIPHRMAGGEWIDAWEVRALTPEEIGARQPQSADRVSFRRALFEVLGMRFSDITGVIAAMPEGAGKEAAIIRFEDSQHIRRNDPLLLSIATQLEQAQVIPSASAAIAAIFSRATKISTEPPT